MTEAERIERFETAYNRIDRALGQMLEQRGDRDRRPFASKIHAVVNRWRRFRPYMDFLLEVGELRNALVHNRTGDDLYLAVPSERTVLELESIEQRVLSPQAVTPQFERKVTLVNPDDTLREVLRFIRNDGYSRYPVYGPEGFVGLLTSNGVARWLARSGNGPTLTIDTEAVTVADVLAEDHRRERVAFVSRTALVDDVNMMFADRKPLEAVIITEHGRAQEPPLGMICPPDLPALVQ